MVSLRAARARFPGYTFRKRTRNNREYVTVMPKFYIQPDYTNLKCVLEHVFPGIRVTSGSSEKVTGALPTLLELIQSPPKTPWVTILRETLAAKRARNLR